MTERIVPEGIILVDRTTMEIDWVCGRKRWWYKEFGEGEVRGIVPSGEPEYLTVGKDIHRDLEALTGGEDVGALIAPLLEALALAESVPTKEVLARRIGWLWAFARHWWPKIADEWEVVSVETEIVLDRSPLWIGVIPDLILRHRKLGHLAYFEWKSVGILGREWVNHWPYAIQIHLGMLAVEEELSEPVEKGRVVGLFKGRDYKGRLAHPYVYGWTDAEGRWRSDGVRGWSPTPTWEYPEGGLLGWLELLGEETAMDQFPTSAEIPLNRRLVESCVRSRLFREQQVRQFRDLAKTDPAVLDSIFEMRTKNCRPPIGSPCDFLSACHHASINADPLRNGEYIPRTPHHSMELLMKEPDNAEDFG